MKIFYINLDRRIDRKESCEEQFKTQNLDFERYPAIDGKNYTFNEKELELFKNSDFKKHLNNLQCMGNFLSHWNIWYKIVEKNLDYAIIFEDDIKLIPKFKKEIQNVISNLPQDSEVVFITQQKDGNSQKAFNIFDQQKESNLVIFFKRKINNNIGILENHINPCTLGYIITRKGAMNLIKHTKKQGVLRATDGHINDYLINKNIFYASILVLGSSNSKFDTDIQINN